MIDPKKEILMAGDTKLSVGDLRNALDILKIKTGDVVCVHSQLFSLGKPLVGKEEFVETIVKVLQEIVGREGMLIMPTFSYSFCKNEVYDMNKSPSTVGLMTEFFRNMSEVCRTAHPIFSFALWGERKEEYLDIGPDAFGLDSVYGRMIQDGGKILMFGANKGYTFYYLAEEHVNVSHRYFKNFSGKIIDDSGHIYTANIPYFVRDLSQKSDLNEEKLLKFLLKNDCQKQVGFGKGTLAVIDCCRAYDVLVKTLREEESSFL